MTDNKEIELKIKTGNQETKGKNKTNNKYIIQVDGSDYENNENTSEDYNEKKS